MMKLVALEPVLTQEDSQRAARLIAANPISAVSTAGPQWVREGDAAALLEQSAVAFVLAGGESGLGVVRVQRLQTPGVFEIALHSADDAALESVGVAAGLDELLRYVTATTEVHRLELWFGVYNRLLLDYCLESERFRCEGVLRDRYFAAGRYWDGLVWSVTGERLRLPENDSAAAEFEQGYQRTAARLRRIIRDQLTPPEAGR
ncbi:hypothetical protein NDR87_10825 [Nocardia sp. CDC159]|uniref:Uncharacterized protein n=1 Tax=Nocardia pulmonis TaxID=2951408 RepID=A0A9X2IWV1_9NOCA|nr:MULTISPECIES: hypothetical protein [Nocardia]MCM6773964.1 hypothetical protein [Nocardia pulmonis]MCM6786851.1 hypothetical protein [Nocardia sp. CDC159]